ncbi:MAG: alpha/beta hydrolase [Candidatus Tectomicrobia bacterium]|uniref:Alpha/beta hydrolase n=1 Tax=Tectimicrobiota bacterium TaxID=2528274 RepID=A0A932HZ02_UNCTE|nr:alpha/beta hydrolase [Candidatus Tectomicrobia bacterium]
MIRKLRTQRDNQQWMLDLALHMRGRVQNFERGDFPEVPQGKTAHNYQMLPKMWRQAAEHHEALAKRAQREGFKATATEYYDHAIEAYRMAQHPIFYDDNPVKIYLCNKLDEMVDRRSETATYPIERVEVPFLEGKSISCLLHLLPDRRKAPCVIYVPGMDQTKESFPFAQRNVAGERGFHLISMDGPGQGASNIRKIRAVGDNYERAGAAVIDYLIRRPEVDASKIGIYGISMGSYWSLRLASYDRRMAAVASAVACFNPNNTIFTISSPRFKQMFMYMAGMSNEEEFDKMARHMTVKGYMDKVQCPTLLATGEFDPLCPLEDAIEVFEDLTCPKEMWVFENQFHPLNRLKNLGGADHHQPILDWLHRVLVQGKPNKRRVAYVREGGDGPFGDCEWTPPVRPGQPYF